MKRMRVAGAALAVSFSTLLGCSSDDTVVAANVASSNDTQYSGITGPDGRDGGFLIPGIPDRILHPGSTSDELQTCKTVRITLSQTGQAPVTHTTIPAQNHWQVDKLDAQGNPIPKTDGTMGNEKEDRAGIAQYYERFTVNGWHDGKATILAEALDAADKVLLTATADVDVMENRAVYGVADLKLPDAPAGSGGMMGSGGAPGSGGASSMGGAESGGSASGGASSEGGSGN